MPIFQLKPKCISPLHSCTVYPKILTSAPPVWALPRLQNMYVSWLSYFFHPGLGRMGDINFNDDNHVTLPSLGQIQDLFGTDLPKIIYLENPVQGREAKNHTLSSGTSASPPVGQIRECSPPLPNPFPVPASQGSHFLINSFPGMLPALSFPFSRRLHTQLLYSLDLLVVFLTHPSSTVCPSLSASKGFWVICFGNSRWRT